MSNKERSILPDLSISTVEARLQTLSDEVIPVFHSEAHPTLESFLSPILEESKEVSNAIHNGEMSFTDARKNLIVVVGAPGSGKTHVYNELNKLKFEMGFPDDHFRPLSWEGAEDEVKVEFTEQEKQETYFSDGRMHQVNEVAMNQLNNAGSWVLGIGEYAPVATKIQLGQPLWMGKDAGTTFIEYVAKERTDINIHVVGLCPESRVVKLATPFRTGGAGPEAVKGYRQKSVQLALSLHERRKINLPFYMIETLRNPNSKINPLQFEEFSNIFEKPSQEFASYIIDRRFPPHTRERKGVIKGFYTQVLRDIFAAEIAKEDVVSLASLYLYNYAFQNELGLPAEHIFLGVSNPDIQKFKNAPVDWDNIFISKKN